MKTQIVLLILFSVYSISLGQTTFDLSDLAKQAELTLEKGITFFHSLAIEGGYVYHYTLDGKETWGEGKTDNRTIEVQPPGTPAVGMSFLRAYRTTGNQDFLKGAEDAAFALIRGQNALGGWEHKIYFDRPTGKRVSFDGCLLLEAKRFRSQEQNRENALNRFADLIRESLKKPKRRKKTKPSAASREKRLQSKQHRSRKKELRKPIKGFED